MMKRVAVVMQCVKHDVTLQAVVIQIECIRKFNLDSIEREPIIGYTNSSSRPVFPVLLGTNGFVLKTFLINRLSIANAAVDEEVFTANGRTENFFDKPVGIGYC